jgi:four helix bundle protein
MVKDTLKIESGITFQRFNIVFHRAEAWGKRKYELHFISKLTDADSEQLETQHWIEISEECNYIDSEKSIILLHKYESIGKMIQSMIDKSSTFCKKNT